MISSDEFVKKTGCEVVDLIQGRVAGFLEHGNVPSGEKIRIIIRKRKFLDQLINGFSCIFS